MKNGPIIDGEKNCTRKIEYDHNDLPTRKIGKCQIQNVVDCKFSGPGYTKLKNSTNPFPRTALTLFNYSWEMKKNVRKYETRWVGWRIYDLREIYQVRRSHAEVT